MFFLIFLVFSYVTPPPFQVSPFIVLVFSNSHFSMTRINVESFQIEMRISSSGKWKFFMTFAIKGRWVAIAIKQQQKIIFIFIIFLTGAKCKLRFIYVKFNCKRKNRVNKWMEKSAIEGANVMKNLHFLGTHP